MDAPRAARWLSGGFVFCFSSAAAAQPDPPAEDAQIAGPDGAPQPLVMAGDAPEEPFDGEHDYRALPYDPWHDGVAAGISVGAMFPSRIDPGIYGRLEIGGYDIQTRRRGVIVGTLVGAEGWGAEGSNGTNWGASLPWIVYAGLQSDALFFALGAGLEIVVFDRVEDDTGIGPLAPVGAASLGLDLEGVRILLDSRADYRWQFGAEDRAALRLGLALQVTTD